MKGSRAKQEQQGVETKATGVHEALNRVFSAVDTGGVYSRSSTVNLIILSSCRNGFSELNALIDSLALVHPGRYFVVYCDQELSSLKVDVAARCVGLRESESLCSEVVMVGASPQNMRAVPSVLRGNFLTGSPVELCIYEPCACEGTFDLIAPLSDLVILDSSQFSSDIAFLRHVSSRFERVVDLEWIGLGLWREQVKLAFSRPAAESLLASLQGITLRGSSGPGRVTACLMAGWILQCLGAQNVRADGGPFVFESGLNGEVKLDLSLADSTKDAVLLEVNFVFSNPDWRRLAESYSVTIRRDQGLQTIIQTEVLDKTNVAFEDESWLGRLSRYYNIGEATTNYRESLERGLSLLEMGGE